MKALSYFIVVENIKEAPKKVGGLELTEKLDADNRYVKAKVITAGNDVVGIKDNDTVYYDKHAGHGITYDDKFYKVVKMQDVALVE
jgi:co-chaperonin GroES (HSP10)|tara:strand:+ start:617 stop:874 length:258 start_codon:yes stop_codon:yes gene_type:complete